MTTPSSWPWTLLLAGLVVLALLTVSGCTVWRIGQAGDLAGLAEDVPQGDGRLLLQRRHAAHGILPSGQHVDQAVVDVVELCAKRVESV